MAVMFDGTDKIQHQAWPWLDKNLLPKNPQGHDKEMREVCLEYFNKLDGYIEKLVKMVGPDAQVFFASDHGFTASTFVLRINTLLEEKRSEEHTSELQSLMRISYAVFCL